MIFDISRHKWDDDLLRALNIPRSMLPEVRDNSCAFGTTDAALFGAPIASTVARIVGSDQGTVKMPLTVYRLGGNDPDKVVGLALEASSFASYQTLTVSLSESKVRELIQSLQSALGNGETEAG